MPYIISPESKNGGCMAALFSKNYYNTDYCASWHICRNTLENPGFDNQSIVFFSYARHVCTSRGEEVLSINPGKTWKVLCITGGNAQFLFGQTAVNVTKNDIVIVGPDDTLRARVTQESKLKLCLIFSRYALQFSLLQ